MSTRETIGTADQLYAGRGFENDLFRKSGRMRGRPISLLSKVDLGAPKLAVAAGIVNGATGATEAPNASTITFTAATQGTTPLDPVAALSSTAIQTVDGLRTCMVLDVPRNVTAAIGGGAVNVVTVTVTGYDLYRQKMVETLTFANTDATEVGLKAFKYIWSIALWSGHDNSAKAINVGFGAVLGLPYRLAAKSDLLSVWLADAVDAPNPATAAVTTSPATASTGDVRGTIVTTGALDGTKTLVAWMHVADDDAANKTGLVGVKQYAG